MMYAVAALAWMVAGVIGAFAYGAATTIVFGGLGHHWLAPVFWMGVSLAAATPLAMATAGLLERHATSGGSLLVWTCACAAGSVVPMLFLMIIWSGVTVSSFISTTEGRLAALMPVAACASFPGVYSILWMRRRGDSADSAYFASLRG